MSLPENTTVLIVGAGPAGLTAALSLAHHGCYDFVIVDAAVKGQNTSRAMTIHSATVEALASIDAADGLLSQAIKGKSMRITSRSSEIFDAKFFPLKKHSAHPYALYIPQIVTELVLEQKLQSLGVVGMKQSEKNSRITDVAFEDGQVIRARYIIGADGARSIVKLHINLTCPILDNDVMTQMVVADVTFEPEPVGPLILEGHLIGTVFSGNFFMVIPLGNHFNAELTRDGKPATKSIFRIACGIHGEAPHAPPKEYIQHLIDTYGPACMTSDSSLNPTPVKVDQLIWSSRFRTHSAIADRTFAPHIHSPFGGQEAVAKYIQTSAGNPNVDDTILRETADARHARALEIIGYSKTLLKLASFTYDSYAWWMPCSGGFIRDLILRILSRFDFVQSKVAWGLSGLGRR
ncbi:FAD/NAD(P)-binding domain-containing protein [Suillus decipiens]|nr:FAD/NAD(P)-binding domain-containing protein [Suillus decipiens]